MDYLQIRDLQFANYNKISFTIASNSITGVFSLDPTLREKFLLLLAGIEEAAPIYYNEKTVFDDEKYFKNRLYFDFDKTYLKTLNPNFIEEALNSFNLAFDKVTFKKEAKQFQLRKGAIFSYYYEFPKENNTLVNLLLCTNIDVSSLIINNPTANIYDIETQRQIMGKLAAQTKDKSIVLGLNSLQGTIAYLTNIIILSDYDKVYFLNQNDQLIVIEDNILVRNKIKRLDNNNVIAFNDYSKAELKQFAKLKIKYTVISLRELVNYI